MPTFIFIPLLIFVALPSLYWGFVLAKLLAIVINRPSVRAGIAAAELIEHWPKLSIIVPAHNEEHEIVACARALLAQEYSSFEVIFVLDRCTDRTAALLRETVADDPRVIIIENNHCPDDWAGKVHAAHIGAGRATGAWLLFTDADTRFDPRLAKASVALASQKNLALFSLLSTLRVHHGFEHIAQPVASMELMKIYPIARVNNPHTGRSFANGQFLLFDRAWYETIGTHATVKDDLLEDIALARAVRQHGGTLGIAFADGMLTCAMYDSEAAFKEGWKRIFIEACHRKPKRLRKYARRIRTVQTLAMVTLPIGVLGGFVLLGIDHAAQGAMLIVAATLEVLLSLIAMILVYRLAGAPFLSAFAFPMGAQIVGRIMRDAAADLEQHRPVRWGGREYALEPR